MDGFKIIDREDLYRCYEDDRKECVTIEELLDDSRMLFDERDFEEELEY